MIEEKGVSSQVPNILIKPASQDFGSIVVGDSTSRAFTVYNTGDGNLKIGELSVTGTSAAEFSILDDNCSGQTVMPESSCTFQVKFSPKSKVPTGAILSILSNDPETPNLEIPLAGNLGVTRIYCNSLSVNLDEKRFDFKRDKNYDKDDPKTQCGDDPDWIMLDAGDAYWKTGTCPQGKDAWVIEYGSWDVLEPLSPLASSQAVALSENSSDQKSQSSKCKEETIHV